MCTIKLSVTKLVNVNNAILFDNLIDPLTFIVNCSSLTEAYLLSEYWSFRYMHMFFSQITVIYDNFVFKQSLNFYSSK